ILAFGTNNTERARIDANGRVGINTTLPTARLEVFAAADSAIVSSANISRDSASGNTFLSNSNAVGNMTFGAVGQVTGGDYGAGLFGRGYGYSFAPFTTRDMGLYGSANWLNQAIGVLGNSDNGTALFGNSSTGMAAYLKAPGIGGLSLMADSGDAIVNTGNLGVGGAPSFKFHSQLAGGGFSGYFTSTGTDNWVGFNNSNGNYAYLGNYLNSTTAFDICTYYGTDLNLGTGYVTRLKVKSDGKIGIGTENPVSIVNISQPNEPVLTITEAAPASGDTMSIDFLKPDNSGLWTDWRIGSIMLGGDFVIQTSGDDFATSPTTRMKISPYGGVTINDGLNLNIGGAAYGRVLTSDATGNASWKENQTGGSFSGGVNAITGTNSMLTNAGSGNTITITSPTQKVMWTVQLALGSSSAGGGTNLALYPAYYNSVAGPTSYSIIGGALIGLSCPQNQRLTYSISGYVSGLTPGTYVFGAVGSGTNFNNNDWYYVTTMVFE
ncbi:MAG TPA: hypothetical protein PLP14_07450, partial [Chitinophagaceae bacterium]|nr:hypothetical protein [Chitinophagaceae bacterium]